MFRHVIIVLLFNSVFVICKHVPEGADCDWDGVKGKCVRSRRCFTSLDRFHPHPLCPEQGDEPLICCTDCDIINDVKENSFWVVLHRFLTRGRYNWRSALPSKLNNRVETPHGKVYYKDGRKARDNCLQYLKEDNICRREGAGGGIRRLFDENKKCHNYTRYFLETAPVYPGFKPNSEYPYQAILGIGDAPETALLVAGGTIISDRYIITVPRANTKSGPLNFIALGVTVLSELSSWQTHKVKRFIAHPDYKEPGFVHDIALVQTERKIDFDKNVLPACLKVEEAEDEKAMTTTWKDVGRDDKTVHSIQLIHLKKFNDSECRFRDNEGFEPATQLCYGNMPSEHIETSGINCREGLGEPLIIRTQFSRCLNTVIGVTSQGPNSCDPNASGARAYTRVSHYVPWIESIVWP